MSDKPIRPEDSTPAERAVAITAAVSSIVPWLGGPISNVLSGYTVDRKIKRVGDVLEGLACDLQELESRTSEEYVKSEDFEDLLEQTLRRVADERSEEKRKLLRGFLVDAIRRPNQDYDEQIDCLRALERLQPTHMELIAALLRHPEGTNVIAGSPMGTLRKRLPHMNETLIESLMQSLGDLRLVNTDGLRVMMTGHGAENLTHRVSTKGRRFLDYVIED